MKIKHLFFAVIGCLLLLTCTSSGCDDEPSTGKNSSSSTKNTKSSISAPSFDKNLTWTDTDGFSIMLRFKNGGDEYDNMSCTVYWKSYPQKPAKTPKASELSRSESMRIYNHNKTKTVFERAHAGYNGGTYIYYYAVCKNSKGKCQSDLTFTIVKR